MPISPKRLVPREIKTNSETKADRSRRLATQRYRTLKADMLRLGRLGGPAYELTPDQIRKLIERLTEDFDFLLHQLQLGSKALTSDDIFE